MIDTKLKPYEKECPECSAVAHVRSKLCVCGHTFKKKGSKDVPTWDLIRKTLIKYDKTEFLHWVDKAEKGSKTAKMALKCIDCAGYERKEVTLCQQIDCANWPDRVYQGKNTDALDDNLEQTDIFSLTMEQSDIGDL